MQTRYIDFAVNGQRITAGEIAPPPVGDTQMYLAARFTVDESWNGLTKHAVFGSNSLAAITVPLAEDGTCFFPAEVLIKPILAVGVGLVGVGDNGERLTTNRVSIPLDLSCYVNGKTPAPPTPDVYTELSAKKFDRNQGTENAGKVLVVGEDGNVIPGEASGGGGGIDTTGAAVGQTVRIVEVNEDGRPTIWEGADYQPRTHWVDYELVNLIPKTTFTPEMDTFFNAPMHYFDTPVTLEPDKEYIAGFDGAGYYLFAREAVIQNIPCVYIGNTILETGEDNGIPFVYVVVPSHNNQNAIVCFDTNEHWFLLQTDNEVIHQIPEKFLPEKEFKIELLPNPDGNGYIASKTFEEIIEAYDSGKHIFAVLGGATEEIRMEFNLIFSSLQLGSGYGHNVIQFFDMSSIDDTGTIAVWRIFDDNRVTSSTVSIVSTGGVSVEDDGNGNVTIVSTGGVSITDDGNGNVVIA